MVSKDIYVGIIDEGIQFSHVDLTGNIWNNLGEIDGNGIDDDLNGYIDDLHGWNAFGDNGTIYAPGADAHGTHVAGTIGALGGDRALAIDRNLGPQLWSDNSCPN